VSAAWDRRIERAERLANGGGPTAGLLAFYTRLLAAQRTVYESFACSAPSGSLENDLRRIAVGGSTVLRAVVAHGPDHLAAEGRTLLALNDSAIADRLLAYWSARSDRQFFPKAILQPYAQWLADAGRPIDGVKRAGVQPDCPRCGGAPQLSILEGANAAAADGSSRQLLCANCLTPWAIRRVLCPHCGEDDERKLCYFQSPAFDHLRVEACDTCRHYLKGVDLGRLGLAVPLVDEVAGAPLDLWALQHGYEKIELNLVGL